jgi:23S rRNA pseudouridine1911/1915/1917 synthase
VFREAAEALKRPALHARVLGFVHPVTGKKIRFEIDPPADFEVILTALRAIPEEGPTALRRASGRAHVR